MLRMYSVENVDRYELKQLINKVEGDQHITLDECNHAFNLQHIPSLVHDCLSNDDHIPRKPMVLEFLRTMLKNTKGTVSGFGFDVHADYNYEPTKTKPLKPLPPLWRF